jgi:Skp family chaperone for outer membrane proteins
MKDILFFAVGASLVGTIFLVSLIELIFTLRRRKVHNELESKLKEMKSTLNQTINQIVLDDEKKILESEKEVAEAKTNLEAERVALEREYQEKLKAITDHSREELSAARARAKRMQEQAELKAEEYLSDRKREVEKELMQIVLSVSRKVIPKGISYDAQRELVMRALRDLNIEKQQPLASK